MERSRGLWEQQFETTGHLVSGSPVISAMEYNHQHDKIESYIHWKIYHYYSLKHSEKLYEPFMEIPKITGNWTFLITQM